MANQTRYLLKEDENSSLTSLGDEQVRAPPNTPTNIEDVTQPKDSKLNAKKKRLQANRIYAARYRLKKLARVHQLTRKIESLQVEVSTTQSYLCFIASAYNMLIEENANLKAYCNVANYLNAEKEVEKQGLIQEIQRLKNNQLF